MAKKVQTKFQLHMPAWKATPAPPVWPILWQHWINIWQFVKEFNDKTSPLVAQFWWVNVKVPCVITVYVDRSYDMEIKPPLTSHLIMWKSSIKKWSWEPNKNKIWKISKKDLEEIAEIKKPVMNTRNTEAIVKILEWTAKNMWLEVV